MFPEHGGTLAELQDRADRAMYVAKARGRNQCVVFSREVSEREDVLCEISMDLASGMRRGEFQLYFQPLVLRNGRLSGFEALLRWNHPRFGIISPVDFIPMAEKSGLILKLGEWVLVEACRACAGWQRTGSPALGIAVNVSALQFEQCDYPDRVLAALASTGLNPSLLTLELTEGVLVRDPARAREHLMRIRLAGVRIALDDFGTGYSSLSYLTELPADVIKLDRSFVSRELSGASTVIESIVSLAHRLGLRVVAEGIETSDQNEGLRNMQCDEFQGYYFSRPITAEAVENLIEALAPANGSVSEKEAELVGA
jgi:EAL domain-containing protein (putative c-di-GMP-specific phosphodiesterase class I)